MTRQLRELIVNGDDFGRSPLTNAGIVRAHRDGILTSASLMVRWPAAERAARYARTAPGFSLGLHVDLGEWAYRDGGWVKLYEHAPFEREVPEQLERFQRLVGRPPTHLDSHQHVHREQPLASLMAELADRLGVPLRDRGAIQYRGDYYGQTGRGQPMPELIDVPALVSIIETLEPGVTELGCHPGLDPELDSTYRHERLREVEVLCDPNIRRAIEVAGVVLRTF